MDALFQQDIAPREKALMKLLTRPATQQQFDAMLCLLYNIGVGSEKKNRPPGFTRSSVRRLFNAGDLLGAADAFLMWNKAGGKVSKGLKIRRAQERAMFLDGNYDSQH
jgi:lysozyme